MDQWAPIDALIAAARAGRVPLAISIFFRCVFEAVRVALRDVYCNEHEPHISVAFLTTFEQELLKIAAARKSQARPDVPLAVIRQRTTPNGGEKHTAADFGLIVHTRDSEGEFIKGVYVQAKCVADESARIDYRTSDGTLQLETLCSHGDDVTHYIFYNAPRPQDAGEAVPPFTMASAQAVASAYRAAHCPSSLPIAHLTTEETAYLALGLMHRASRLGKLFLDPETAVAAMVKPFPNPEAALKRLWVVHVGTQLPNPKLWEHYLRQYTGRVTPGVPRDAQASTDEEWPSGLRP